MYNKRIQISYKHFLALWVSLKYIHFHHVDIWHILYITICLRSPDDILIHLYLTSVFKSDGRLSTPFPSRVLFCRIIPCKLITVLWQGYWRKGIIVSASVVKQTLIHFEDIDSSLCWRNKTRMQVNVPTNYVMFSLLTAVHIQILLNLEITVGNTRQGDGCVGCSCQQYEQHRGF